MGFRKIDAFRWEIPRTGEMRVPGLIYASEEMLPKLEAERVAQQVSNVATLPGITGYSMAMPDAHWGYGFPIGGVAAMNAETGVISPGGVGYDISCGVRLLKSSLKVSDVSGKIPGLMDALFGSVPSGVGSEGNLRLNRGDIRKVLEKGAAWAVENGFGDREDLETTEDGGTLKGADPESVSPRAVERGAGQLGTLGSGNHFLEVQEVDEIYDESVAGVFGLFKGQLALLIHTGSRGLGYQVCDDFLKVMQTASSRYNIFLPDRQLACAPFDSEEGRKYFGAMNAAGNFAKANREVVTHYVREAFMKKLGMSPRELGMSLVYDVSHNIAKIEEHVAGGRLTELIVHRKGATRAFPPGNKEIPPAYRETGQPVLVPGSMGTFSYVLTGTGRAMSETFGSVCHGAGRLMSRTQALKMTGGRDLRGKLLSQGIEVRTASVKGLAEEAPYAYKDVSEVVNICRDAGIALKVARMRPLGVVKG